MDMLLNGFLFGFGGLLGIFVLIATLKIIGRIIELFL